MSEIDDQDPVVGMRKGAKKHAFSLCRERMVSIFVPCDNAKLR